MSLSAEILCRIVGIETDTADIAKNTRVTKAEYFRALSDGDGANQAQVIYSDARASAGTDTFQLSSLPDTRDGAAVTIAFTAVKAMYVRNTHATNSLTLSASASPFASQIVVVPQGVVLVANPSNTGALSFIGAAVTHFITAPVGTTYEIVIVGEGSIT